MKKKTLTKLQKENPLETLGRKIYSLFVKATKFETITNTQHIKCIVKWYKNTQTLSSIKRTDTRLKFVWKNVQIWFIYLDTYVVKI